ncbi:MAG: phosphohistidine phosphatase SixA [Gemmatimonadota bacterium]|nr:phosphohistidine phosphatase SixA [Gemmatimonadota bacterium]
MRLLVIRHAIAEKRADFARSGKRDARRPLTDEGMQRMEQAVQGLRNVVPTIDHVASSPHLRAMQTAKIVASAFELRTVERLSALEPGGDTDLILDWLRGQDDAATIALVGHEPDASALISYLITSDKGAAIQMKKGAVCLLEVDEEVEPGQAMLRWLLSPKVLRALGGDA